MNFRTAMIFVLVIMALINRAQAATPDAAQIRFRVNSAEIDSTYAGNSSALASLYSLASMLTTDTLAVPEAIYIQGYASPEGPGHNNLRLAEERRMAVQELLLSRYPELSAIVTGSSEVISWQMVVNLISESDNPLKERFTRILSNATANNGYVSAPWLASVDGGRLWRVLEPVLSDLRVVDVRAGYTRRLPEENPGGKEAEAVVPAAPDTVAACEVVAAELATATPRKPFYMSVRTNMLYDAVAIPTLGGEFYLGKNLSLGGQWSYAWWSRNKNHRYWRYYGGDLELRWWFGNAAMRKPLTGHHLGVYAQILTYDIEFGGKGQMGHKFNYGGGIEYGFSLPVARRLNIDFSLGIGYIGGEYYKYVPVDGHYVWQSTHRRNWFGPTKAEISLVWLIGRGNVNARKGGGR